jgi:hypothetical protein
MKTTAQDAPRSTIAASDDRRVDPMSSSSHDRGDGVSQPGRRAGDAAHLLPNPNPIAERSLTCGAGRQRCVTAAASNVNGRDAQRLFQVVPPSLESCRKICSVPVTAPPVVIFTSTMSTRVDCGSNTELTTVVVVFVTPATVGGSSVSVPLRTRERGPGQDQEIHERAAHRSPRTAFAGEFVHGCTTSRFLTLLPGASPPSTGSTSSTAASSRRSRSTQLSEV